MTVALAQQYLSLSEKFLAQVNDMAKTFPKIKIETHTYFGDVFAFDGTHLNTAIHSMAKEFAAANDADFVATNAVGSEWAFRFKNAINQDGKEWALSKYVEQECVKYPNEKEYYKSPKAKARWIEFRLFVKTL